MKQEEIRETLELWENGGCPCLEDVCNHRGKDQFSHEIFCRSNTSYDCLMKRLTSLGVVIKGQSLGASHPHLASYFTVESLIKED